MLNIIYLSIIACFIFSIIIFVKSINSKNKTSSIYFSVINIVIFVYLYVLLYLPFNLELDIGLGYLMLVLLIIINGIIILINIIINIVKIFKYDFCDDDRNIKKFLLLLLIPIMILLITYFHESVALKNSDYILTYNYQNGIVTSETNRYAINSKGCTKFDIGNKLIDNSTFVNYKDYDIYSDNKGIYFDVDIDLSREEQDIIKRIIRDSLPKNSGKVNYYDSYIIKIKGSNYYIIENKKTSAPELDYGSVLGEYIYYNDKRICKINAPGDLEEIISINKKTK